MPDSSRWDLWSSDFLQTMKLIVFHVFLLILVIWVVHSHGRAYETESIIYNNTQQPYKENLNVRLWRPQSFYLVMMWRNSYRSPNSFGSSVPCYYQLTHNYFIVHGLWPQLGGGGDSYCPDVGNTRFDFQPLKRNHNLVNTLNYYWPNLRDEPNECFWNYQYKKHGYCFFPTLVDYFQTAVGIMEQIPDLYYLSGKLKNEGIEPGSFHSFVNLQQKISRVTRVLPVLQCSPRRQLFQIYFCANVSGHLVSCPNDLSSNVNCDRRGQIKLP